ALMRWGRRIVATAAAVLLSVVFFVPSPAVDAAATFNSYVDIGQPSSFAALQDIQVTVSLSSDPPHLSGPFTGTISLQRNGVAVGTKPVPGGATSVVFDLGSLHAGHL